MSAELAHSLKELPVVIATQSFGLLYEGLLWFMEVSSGLLRFIVIYGGL